MEYKWTLSALDCAAENKLIMTAHWRYSLTDGDVSVETYGAQTFEAPQKKDFIPFDALTKDIILGWLESVIDMEAMQANLLVQLEEKKNPKVVTLNLEEDVN